MGRALRAAGRRLAVAVPTLVAMTFVTYALARLAPGEPWWGDVEAGAVTVRQTHSNLVSDYLGWLGDWVRLDWGRSIVDRRLVSARIGEALPVTLGLTGLAMVLAWSVAVPLGVWLARNRRSRVAQVISQVLLATSSVPSAWVALLAVITLASRGGPFPAYGWRSDAPSLSPLIDLVWHAALPAGCLALGLGAVVARQMESAMGEALEAPFSFGARARGVPEAWVVWRHALPNAALTMLTVLGMQLPHLIGGGVVIERAFGLPGMGVLALDALLARDYPVVMGVASLIALATVAAMAIVDALAAALDPRTAGEGAP